MEAEEEGRKEEMKGGWEKREEGTKGRRRRVEHENKQRNQDRKKGERRGVEGKGRRRMECMHAALHHIRPPVM